MLDDCIAEISDDLEEITVTECQEPLPKRPRPAILNRNS